MESNAQISEWRGLPGGWGDALATDGDHAIAASPAGITIWQGQTRLRTVVPEGAFAVGLPRLVAGRVVYGTGRERPDGSFEPLALPSSLMGPPGDFGSPRAAAWSADGARVAVLWVDGSGATILDLHAGGSAPPRVIWKGDPPPGALWSGANAIAAIGRDMQAWNAQGEHRAEGHAGGVNAVSASRDESRLFTVGWEGTAKLWDTATWSMIAELHGSFAGGAIAPDGRTAVLLTRGHVLHAVCADAQGHLTPAWDAPVAGTPVAVALGEGWIVGSFREDPRIRRAQIHIRCG
jgi:hypothetical protein